MDCDRGKSAVGVNGDFPTLKVMICVFSMLALLVLNFAHAADERNLSLRSANASNRVALVIGNDSYHNIASLKNARNDASAVAKALENAGFQVTLKLDANEKAMKEALRNFKGALAGGDVAVFYYSGHGLQLGAANYLIPTDIRGQTEGQVKDDAIPLQRILDDLQEQKVKFSLAIIDACRDNPFKASGKSIGGVGLGPTSAATGQMVLFSAGNGQKALDKLGPSDKEVNGVFTRVFLKEIERPGVPIDRLVRDVREEVVQLAKSVNHEQVPALYDQSLGEFYFHPAQTVVANAVGDNKGNVYSAGVSGEDFDTALWKAVVEGGAIDDYDVYLKQYPQGKYAALAARRLQRLHEEARKAEEENGWHSGQSFFLTEGTAKYPAAEPTGRNGLRAKNRGEANGDFDVSRASREFRDCADCPPMMAIPSGEFEMGSNQKPNEAPIHRVNVKSFAIGKTLVTQGQWQAIMGSNPSYFSSCGDDCPVENVGWADAKKYIQKLSEKTGRLYRLPSEAEWEYACRSGERFEYCGSDKIDDVAWYESNSKGMTHPVAAKQPNAWGLFDMSGNVEEWLEDCTSEDYYGAPTDGSVWLDGVCSLHMRRGGSWNDGPMAMRASSRGTRYRFDSLQRSFKTGFRMARMIR